MDYILAGASPIDDNDQNNNRVGYTLFKANRYWQKFKDGNGDVIFSFDAGTQGGKMQPHGEKDSILGYPGMNIMETNGSGRWISRDQSYFHQWHTPSYPDDYRPMPLAYRIPYRAFWSSTNNRMEIRMSNAIFSSLIFGGNDSYDSASTYGIMGKYVTD